MAYDSLLTTSLLQIVNRQQAGKIDNFKQTFGVFGSVLVSIEKN